jgi:hypothetical protein
MQRKMSKPKLLRAMYTLVGTGLQVTHDTVFAFVPEQSILAFFAMRSCEILLKQNPDRTRVLRIAKERYDLRYIPQGG